MTRARDFHPPEDISVEVNAMFAEDLELLGYDIDLSPRQPGDVINITTYWKALRTMSRSYITSIHLLDYTMTMWGQSDTVLGGTYAHLLWAPGEFVKEEYALTVAPNAPPGLHTIEFGIFHHLKGEYSFLPVTESDNPDLSKHIILGQVRVLDSDRAKSPDTRLIVNLGEQIQLRGFDLSRQDLTTAEPLALALYWQAVDEPTADYTVFTQLIGPDSDHFLGSPGSRRGPLRVDSTGRCSIRTVSASSWDVQPAYWPTPCCFQRRRSAPAKRCYSAGHAPI